MKKYKVDKICLWCIALVLFVVGSFNDLKISQTLYDSTSIFGRIFENHLLTLVFIPVIASGWLLFKTRKNIVYLLISIGVSINAGIENLTKYFTGATKMILGILLGLIIFVLVSQFSKKILKNLDQQKAINTLKIFFLVVGVIYTIKYLIGRVRYRDLQTLTQYSNWYDLNLFQKGNSFPSGHTSTIYLLIPFLKIYEKDFKILRLIAYIIIILMALSRIIIGAHYLTDTMAALLIAISIDILWEKKSESQNTSISNN